MFIVYHKDIKVSFILFYIKYRIPFLNRGAIFVDSVVANPHVHIVRSGFLLLAASISSLI